MSKDSTKNQICPVCAQEGFIHIRDLTKDITDYSVDCFCPHCTEYAHQRKHTNKKQNMKLRDQRRFASSVNADEIMERIFLSYHIGIFNNSAYYCKAFGKILEWAPDRRALKMPVYNAWNDIAGGVYINSKSCKWTKHSMGMAAIMSNTYRPKKLVVTDNPVTALAVRYNSSIDHEEPYATMVIAPGKRPCFRALLDPEKVLVFISDPELRQSLMEILPEDAILSNRSLSIKPGAIMSTLWSAENAGAPLSEWEHNKIDDFDS